MGTSTFVPGIPFVMERFSVGREVAVLPLSLYTLGFTIGPVIAAPLSELYGRRSVYWTTMPLLLIFTAIAASSNNIATLIIFRFLAGFGGSGALAVGAGTSPLPSSSPITDSSIQEQSQISGTHTLRVAPHSSTSWHPSLAPPSVL